MIFSEYLGIDSDYVIVGLAALVLILFIVTIVNICLLYTSDAADE